MFDENIDEILDKDERYAPEAYEFLFRALAHTQKMLDRVPPNNPEREKKTAGESKYHVSGRELLEGARSLALRDFGFMARTVFKMWGINETGDFGNIVFNLIEAGLMSKTERDNRQDFQDAYDLDEALVKDFQLRIDEESNT